MPGKREGQQLSGAAVERRPRVAKSVVTIRVNWILEQIERGYDGADLTPLVAAKVKKEAQERADVDAERKKLTDAGNADALARLEDPPTVWHGEVPPERTLRHYVQQARNQLEERGRHLGKAGNYILGSQWRRGNMLLALALDKGDLAVAQRVWAELNSMFGLQKLKIEIAALAPPAEKEGYVPEETALTEEQAVNELSLIRARAIERGRILEQNRLAAATPVESEVKSA